MNFFTETRAQSSFRRLREFSSYRIKRERQIGTGPVFRLPFPKNI